MGFNPILFFGLKSTFDIISLAPARHRKGTDVWDLLLRYQSNIFDDQYIPFWTAAASPRIPSAKILL